MPTVQDIANEALAEVNSSAGLLNAAAWVNARYRELIASVRFHAQRRVGILVIPARVNTGTATATRGSNTITGNAAAQAVWSSQLIGRHIRLSVTWYKIVGTTPDGTALRIEGEYGEADASAVSYDIVQRYHTLPTDVRWPGFFTHMRMRRTFKLDALELLDLDNPARQYIGAGPERGAEVGADENGAKLIELYPFCDAKEVIHYTYLSLPEKLGLTEMLPNVVDAFTLKEGVLANVMRWEMSQALHHQQFEVGATWRNDYRSQETRWEEKKRLAIATDRGDSETTFLWRSARFGGTLERRELQTAEDHVWITGSELNR